MQRIDFPLKKKIFFSLIPIIALFSIVEVGLRAYGFQYSQFPREMKQKFADFFAKSKHITEFSPHSERMWALKPNQDKVNKFGYQGAPVPVKRNPGFKRILFLGDSCVNAGKDHFPEKTILKLNEKYHVQSEAIIAGTGSYSTYQGLKWLPEFIGHKPDVLVVYFGWNDHWYAMGGGPDNDFVPISQANIIVKKIFRDLRFFQFLHFLIYPPKSYNHQVESSATIPERITRFVEKTRVPPNYFIYNIERIIQIALKNNVEIYFIEAPYGKHVDQVNAGFHVPISLWNEISVIHQAYQYLLRETVKRYAGVHIVRYNDVDFDRTLMMGDGIHPTEKGYNLIADRLVKKMRETSYSLF